MEKYTISEQDFEQILQRVNENNSRMLELDEWVEEQSQEWQEIGEECKALRKVRGVSVKEIASLLGISEARIYKFENGQPVRDARLIESSYKMAVNIVHLRNHVQGMRAHFRNQYERNEPAIRENEYLSRVLSNV